VTTTRTPWPGGKPVGERVNGTATTGTDNVLPLAAAPGRSNTKPLDLNDVVRADGLEAARRAFDAEVTKSASRRLAASTGLVTVRAADVKPRNIVFVWPNGQGKRGGRLARGKHTCVAGEGGLGKSTLLIYATAVITRGGLWPCGEGRSPIGDVIILSAEDGLDDVLVPRLMAAGAGMERVHIIKALRTGQGERRFNLQSDLGELEKKIRQLRREGRDVVLVWIDPVSSYMGKVDSHNNTALRNVLDPIGEMAERTDVAFASVTHFNKGCADKGIRAMHRVMGGAAFTTAPRAAFAVIRDPDDENRCLLLHLKNNLGIKPQGLAYRVHERVVGTDERTRQEIWASYVQFEAAPVEKTADEAISQNEEGREDSTAKDDCIEFLRTVLADGPKFVKEIENEAINAGLHQVGKPIGQNKPLRDARKVLGVASEKAAFNEGWTWSLPKMPSDAEDDLKK
jgi:putative DNA primase/helicase